MSPGREARGSAEFFADQLRNPTGFFGRSHLPFGDGEFTKACTVNTVYFWPEPAATMKELSRVLATGGRLVIGFSPAVAMRKMPRRLTDHGFTLFEPDEVRRLFEDAGFGAIEMVAGHGKRSDFLCGVGTKSA